MEDPAKRQCTRWPSEPGLPTGSQNASTDLGCPPPRLSLAVSPPSAANTSSIAASAPSVDAGALLEGLSSRDFDFDARKQCRYGHSCYRKNEQHKKEYSHPGDEDWAPVQVSPAGAAAAASPPPQPQAESDDRHASPVVVSSQHYAQAAPQAESDDRHASPVVVSSQHYGEAAAAPAHGCPEGRADDASWDPSAEQAEALAAVRAGKNVFITGCGGTGKSYLLNKIFEGWKKDYGEKFSRKVFITAPTGIAASHINGTTIHAASGVGVPTLRKCGKSEFKRLWKERNKVRWKEVAKIVLDEVSMFSAEWFDCLDEQVREVIYYGSREAAREAGEVYDASQERVLGGKQLVFVGDFFQLPPIENSQEKDAAPDTAPDATASEAKRVLLDWLQLQAHKRPANNREANPETSEFNIENWFFNRGYAFQSDAWAKSNFQFVELKQCFRQSDEQMVEHLGAIRIAATSEGMDQATSYFNTNCHGCLTASDGYTALYATNADVDRINAENLKKLDAPLIDFHSKDAVSGDRDAFHTVTGAHWVSDEDACGGPDGEATTPHPEQKEWEAELKGNTFFQDCLAVGEWKSRRGGEDTRISLDLKTGALVMLLRNIDTKGKLVNGSQGKIVDWVNAAEHLEGIEFRVALEKVEGSLSEVELAKLVRQAENLTAFVQKNSHIEELKLPVVRFDKCGGRPEIIHVVEPERFEATVPALGLCYRVQLPLKLGWAITVHKSQGMTLDRAKMNLDKCQADGQVYVALSRAKTMAGLRLEQPLKLGQIHSADVVREFYSRCREGLPIIGPAQRAGGKTIHHWSTEPDKSAEDLVKVNWPPGSSRWESCKAPLSGCLVKIEEPPAGCNRSFQGKTFVITGEFRNTTREEVKNVCIKHGGKVTQNVSRVTTHLIHGEKLMTGEAVDTSKKYKKAKEVKTVVILDEDRWRHMVLTSKDPQALMTSFFSMKRLHLTPIPISPVSGRTFATSNFKHAYERAEAPEGAMDLGGALHSLIQGFCRKNSIDWQGHGLPFLKNLQREAKQNLDDPIAEMTQRMWTSFLELQDTEFCHILNATVRTDDADLCDETAVVSRGINTLCVTAGREGGQAARHPPDNVCYRGSGFDDAYRSFFVVGRSFRQPAYLATSFTQAKADFFLQRSPLPSKVRWLVRIDPVRKCVHVNLVRKRVPNLPDEQEYLFAPYSAFTVTSVTWTEGTVQDPHVIELLAAVDNKEEPEDLPLAPWS